VSCVGFERSTSGSNSALLIFDPSAKLYSNNNNNNNVSQYLSSNDVHQFRRVVTFLRSRKEIQLLCCESRVLSARERELAKDPNWPDLYKRFEI
jgi:hypothetical protein